MGVWTTRTYARAGDGRFIRWWVLRRCRNATLHLGETASVKLDHCSGVEHESSTYCGGRRIDNHVNRRNRGEVIYSSEGKF